MLDKLRDFFKPKLQSKSDLIYLNTYEVTPTGRWYIKYNQLYIECYLYFSYKEKEFIEESYLALANHCSNV